jgi:hypothetical protein
MCGYSLVILKLNSMRFEVKESAEGGREGSVLGTLEDLRDSGKGLGYKARDNL